MKRPGFFLFFVISGSIILTSLAGEGLLKQFEGHWMIRNTNSAVIDSDFIAIGEYKGYKTVSICFISKVIKQKDHFVIKCNAKPSKAAKEKAKKVLESEQQPWEDMNVKDILKTDMKLFPTRDGFKIGKDGREYWKM